MPPFEEYQKLKTDVDFASKEAGEAVATFNATQNKVNEDIVQGLHQLSYLAAGTISLSITFLGYILGQGEVARLALHHLVFVHIQVIWILFTSWIFLFLVILGGQMYRFINAWYLYAEAGALWTEKSASVKGKILDYVIAGMPIVFREAGDRVEGRTQLEVSKENYLNLNNTFKKSKEFWFLLVEWSRKIVVWMFILGMLALLVFVVAVVSRISQ